MRREKTNAVKNARRLAAMPSGTMTNRDGSRAAVTNAATTAPGSVTFITILETIRKSVLPNIPSLLRT